MKYAILSDVHGNFPALQKVLEDAKQRGIEDFIIAGDYALSGACLSLARWRNAETNL